MLNNEQKIVNQLKAGKVSARKELASMYKDFITSVAKEYETTPDIPFEKLLSASEAGFIKAALNFEYGRGFSLLPFAIWWMRRSILHQIHCLNPQ